MHWPFCAGYQLFCSILKIRKIQKCTLTSDLSTTKLNVVAICCEAFNCLVNISVSKTSQGVIELHRELH